MRIWLYVGLLCTTLAGCDKLSKLDDAQPGRFQMMALPVNADTPGIGALILDTRNGDVWLWSKVQDKTAFTYQGRSVTEIIRYDAKGKRLEPSIDVLLKKYSGKPAD